MIAVVLWLRLWMFVVDIVEVPASNPKFFLTFFMPCGDCSIRVSPPCDFTLVWFAL